MPNIPTRERQGQVQNPMPRQPQYSTPQSRQAQSRPQAPTQPRVNVQQQRYNQTPQIRTLTPPSAERIRPIKPATGAAKSAAPQKTQNKKKQKRTREHTTIGDFLLSFFVALFVFGVAAIFVCNAIISLFT